MVVGGYFYGSVATTGTARRVQVATLATPAADGASCLSAPSPFLDAADDDFQTTLISAKRRHRLAGNAFTNDTRNGLSGDADVIEPTTTG